jgi:hypothetical protein
MSDTTGISASTSVGDFIVVIKRTAQQLILDYHGSTKVRSGPAGRVRCGPARTRAGRRSDWPRQADSPIIHAGKGHYTGNVMQQSRSIHLLVLLIAASLISIGFVQTAGAGIISTEAALELQERNQRIERINSVLARDNVQQQLIAFGVDPAAAQERIASLSDSELEVLQQRMDTLPAGADSALTVLGIVLLVLLVLELVGVTDIFKSF